MRSRRSGRSACWATGSGSLPPGRVTPAVRFTILQFGLGPSGVRVEHAGLGRRASAAEALGARATRLTFDAERRSRVEPDPIFHIAGAGRAQITLCGRGHAMKTVARLGVHRGCIPQHRQTHEQRDSAEVLHDISVVFRLDELRLPCPLEISPILHHYCRRRRERKHAATAFGILRAIHSVIDRSPSIDRVSEPARN